MTTCFGCFSNKAGKEKNQGIQYIGTKHVLNFAQCFVSVAQRGQVNSFRVILRQMFRTSNVRK